MYNIIQIQCLAEVCVDEERFCESCFLKISHIKNGIKQLCPKKGRRPEVRLGEVRLAKVRLGEVRPE